MNKLGDPMDGDDQSDDGCPDFELLSHFADGEITADRGASVAAHLGACQRCASLAHRLQAGFGAEESHSNGKIGGSGCAGEESLILYLMEGLPMAERLALDAHLRTCDACVSSLTTVHRRIGVLNSVAVPVPGDVMERASHGLESAMRREGAAARSKPGVKESWRAALGVRLAELLRPPMLVPAGVALGALIMVTVQESGIFAPPPTELSRSVNREQQLRVTAPLAVVRRAPDRQSEIVMTVDRGTLLRVDVEERHWYRVVLPGEKEGWIEDSAFE